MSGEVLISAENSTDLTMTVAAEAELTQFVDRNSADLAATTARSTTNDLKKKYRVYRVDLEKIEQALGGSGACGKDTETLILPGNAMKIRYAANEDLHQQPTDPEAASTQVAAEADCEPDLLWDEPTYGSDTEQDDPPQEGASARAANRPYAQMIAGDCFTRKKQRKKFAGNSYYTSWNDSCYKNYVERYDGNPKWNYYSKFAKSTCGGVGKWRLKSCGHGVKRNTSGPAVHWLDWAPNASQDRNDCRSRSASVSLKNITVSQSYDVCEKQLIYKYAEAGKMSSYWRGTATSTRGTAHQVSVYVGQKAGRPKWTHWTNSNANPV
ncbi:hypothetical protein ACIRPP_05945 [Streptomyces sp. NPDC101219]|uniref:hypothetical protein n=1 Tax=Streptomyces sp. NPDC101219 TaxID=3366131 RepID=UPI003803ABCA